MGCLFEQVVDNRVAASAMMRIARTCCRHLGLLRPGGSYRLRVRAHDQPRADLEIEEQYFCCGLARQGAKVQMKVGDCVGRW